MFHRYAAAAAVVLLALCGPASADWFDNFNGGTHYTWSWGGNGAIFGLGEDNVMKAQTIGNPPAWATFGYGYPTSAPNTFTDGTITATLNPGGLYPTNDLMGVFFRANTVTGSSYLASVNTTTGDFDLVRTQNNAPVASLGHEDLPLQTNREYYLSLQAWGSQITAVLSDSTGSLATLSAPDLTLTSGIAGLFVSADPNTPNFPLLAVFDNAGTVSGIPEPASMVLMGLGGMGLLGYAWRRRRARAQ